jgi:hypothetical protein
MQLHGLRGGEEAREHVCVGFVQVLRTINGIYSLGAHKAAKVTYR